MIDIHAHLLPFLDDGAADWQEAVQMARQAAEDGIRAIVATPHHANGRFLNPGADVVQAVDMLNRKIQELKLDLIILPGQEVRVYDDLLKDMESGFLLTLNQSKYLLLELPSSNVPRHMEELIYELSLLGIQVIIAHPERNAEIAADPRKMEELAGWGALGQITAQSVAGKHGRKLQKLSLQLCQMNVVQLVATDAHDTSRRPFRLTEAYEVLKRELGPDVELYFKDNAKRVIQNQPISRVEFNTQHLKRRRMNRLLKIFSS